MSAFKISAIFVAVLTAATAAVAAPPDPLMWVWQNAWPKPKTQQQVPLPPPSSSETPKATRSIEHRKVHRPAPKISKREAKPLPRVKAVPPIATPEKRERVTAKKHRVAVRKQRRPTASECARMTSAGRAVVEVGGRIRGYPSDVVDRALRDCGL